MHGLATALVIVYYVVLGLYALIAAGVATSCLVAVTVVVIRQLARDVVDAVAYPPPPRGTP
jgi:hypothetical protein